MSLINFFSILVFSGDFFIDCNSNDIIFFILAGCEYKQTKFTIHYFLITGCPITNLAPLSSSPPLIIATSI